MSNNPIEAVRQFARNKYAWPGGYPMVAIMADGGCLCHKCVKENYRLILTETRSGFDKQWQVAAVDINWEDGDLYCDNCNDRIESAYADKELP